jgi:TolB-like protein
MLRLGCIVILLSACGLVWADVPATQPSAANLLVCPIVSLNRNDVTDLAARGLRANLLVELSRRSDLAMMTLPASAEAVTDDAAAVRQGRAAGAQFAVYGSCQQAGTEMRLLGAVVDCDTGHAIASFKITGSSDDLFDMEDHFSQQVLKVLPQRQQPSTPSVSIVQANSGPMVDFSRPKPSPWDRHFTDVDAADSMQNLRYSDLGNLAGYGWGWGGCYGGYSYYPTSNYNYVGYGPVWGWGLPGAREVNSR